MAWLLVYSIYSNHQEIMQMTQWSFIEKTSVMQDPNLKCVGNFRWDVPPSRGIWWPRAELHKVNDIFRKCNWEDSLQSDVPTCRGIWWSKAVLHQVSLTFSGMQLRRQLIVIVCSFDVQLLKECNWESDYSQMYPPEEASSGHKQHYIRSALHLFAHSMFSSCRSKSYIGLQEIWALEHWAIYVDWSFCCCCCCCCCCCSCSCSCCCVILLLFICDCGCTMTDEQQQQNIYTETTIRQKTFPVQFSRAQLRSQMTVRHILIRCTPW